MKQERAKGSARQQVLWRERRRRQSVISLLILVLALVMPATWASYVNFESSQVHPIALSPAAQRLLVLNTPDNVLELYTVDGAGVPSWQRSIPVGLEPISVRFRSETEAWVVSQLSDAVQVVDLELGIITRTLRVGDEPTDVAFANGKAFVSIATEDRLEVFSLAELDAPAQEVPLFGRKPRALAVSPDASQVYAVVLLSGNQTTIINSHVIHRNQDNLTSRAQQLGLNPMRCDGGPSPYPPLPTGIVRSSELPQLPNDQPEHSLIVKWNEATQQWEDETGQDWTQCVPYRMPDSDLFIVNTETLDVTEVASLGTTLFDVSVQPGSGRIYVPATDARNAVRFEHPLGLQGHVVDNLLSIVDPSSLAVKRVDLNAHINRASDPNVNQPERAASISQPGMIAWKADGSAGFMTVIGSRKLFRVSGSCQNATCIVGANRAQPDAVEVGEGPTGVAVHPTLDRAYVLNRFTNELAIVDTESLSVLDTIAMHDPSDPVVKVARRFMYDGELSSAHGDSSCASCHISGDRDGLAWDLGNPAGQFQDYDDPADNVRFINPVEVTPECESDDECADFDGFDPQKGPMTTQTFRGMLEPLHWRGDRATFESFNPAFVGLLGAANQGVNGATAGLSDEDMALFREFVLAIQFPPNPYRNLDGTLPNESRPIPGVELSGNPARGEQIYLNELSAISITCDSCHTLPFGAAGGKLGGVEPTDPVSLDAGALVSSTNDLSLSSDLKVPHLRNMYEKFGPVLGTEAAPSLARSGFGYGHDGSLPNLPTFFSLPFTINAQESLDLSAFMAHFDTGTAPAVGRSITLPAGSRPTGTPAEEAVLDTLMSLGDGTDEGRHCDLVAYSIRFGELTRLQYLDGLWRRDFESPRDIQTFQLRRRSESPITFVCVPKGSGPRIALDRDMDGVLNLDDCSAADPSSWGLPSVVRLTYSGSAPSLQLAPVEPGVSGPGLRYEILSGTFENLGGQWADTVCLTDSADEAGFTDTRPNPPAGGAYFYLARAVNSCGSGPIQGRAELDSVACP